MKVIVVTEKRFTEIFERFELKLAKAVSERRDAELDGDDTNWWRFFNYHLQDLKKELQDA